MTFSKPIVRFDVTGGRHSARDAALYARANDPQDFADRIVELLDDGRAVSRRPDLDASAWKPSSAGIIRSIR